MRTVFNRPVNRRRIIRPGTLEHLAHFESKILGNERQVTIYLPPGYAAANKRYPVLYMHDGQNVFEPQRAFIPGQNWKLREVTDAMIAARKVEPLIIVAVDHAGPGRIDEYTPTRDDARHGGGKAQEHLHMLLDELKPLIDSQYRTDPGNTGIGGSSLGGLDTLFAGLTHPHVFSKLAVMSPAVWWGNRKIFDYVDNFAARRRPKIWLDIGGREGMQALRDARLLRDRLQANGWDESNLHYYEDRRADHSERSWAGRVRKVLEYLFPV